MNQIKPISRLNAWLESLRSKTLLLVFSSTIVGSTLVVLQGSFNWNIAILTLLTASLLQILSNLANDYGDAVKGSDTEERIGPNRGMQKGVITQPQMKIAIIITILLTILSGSLLLILACQKPSDIIGFTALGLLSIIAAITYTVGNKPYGYQGAGDISVLIFFGWVSVIGTYYLQTTHFDAFMLLPATACGFLATAVLNANNLRDIELDALNGKNTFAVRLGPIKARRYHVILIACALICLVLFSLIYTRNWQSWLFLLAIPTLYKHTTYVLSQPTAVAMKPMLEHMVKCALLTNLLFALGIVLS